MLDWQSKGNPEKVPLCPEIILKSHHRKQVSDSHSTGNHKKSADKSHI